jgi:hypothetical protein
MIHNWASAPGSSPGQFYVSVINFAARWQVIGGVII